MTRALEWVASRAARETLFGGFSAGNEALAVRYGLGVFPCVAEKGEPAYPGLSLDTEAEIRLRLYFLMNKPLNRLEIAARRCAGFIMERLPGGRQILAPVRALHHRIRLQFSGW